MKILEVLQANLGIHSLDESDMFVAEMANFLADVTELPANIVLWTRPQPLELAHNKYRMKVFKDRIHVATYSIGLTPKLLWEILRDKYRLDSDESAETVQVISKFSSLFVQYVDGKLSSDDVKYEIRRSR
jgi:hypothetical protein